MRELWRAFQERRARVFSRDGHVQIAESPFSRELFGNTYYAWIWLLVRLYLGWNWLESGRHKLEDPKWMETGVALKGFWERAVAIPEQGRPAIVFDWYRSFLQLLLEGGNHVWFAKLVAYGETLVGIALLLGVLTGIGAFFGAFMNWHFMMAGTASTNPVLFALAVALVLAWRTGGYYGLDRWLLPLLGTPWQPARAVVPGEAGSDRPATASP